MKYKIIAITAVILVVTGVYIYTKQGGATNDSLQPQTNTTNAENLDTTNVTTSEDFNKGLHNTNEPTSVWFVANKHFALPTTYEPSDLTVLDVPLRLAPSEQQMKIREITANDLTNLFNDANTLGLQLAFGSGYRSADLQKQFYTAYVAKDGQTAADRYSARPGYSEHQTGLALDFTRKDLRCNVEACFGDLPEGKWLAENAYKYGFILRYTSDKEQVTGYMFEPWHYRYVGKELALEMHSKGIKTLEEFFGLGAAPDYKD